jgi:EAL domain-containing protein (putative c-di-GMP-specific phosphodiesterase class I)/ActR/RegA family two-component response regulator
MSAEIEESEFQRVREKARVLLVDDDPQILIVLSRVLASELVEVTTATTGAAALACLAQGDFDTIVSDIQMPGMSGLKLLRAVREYDLDLPIVLMTGEPNVSGAAAAVEYGAFQYLIKPVGVDRLRALVKRAIDFGRIARLKRRCAEEYGSGSFYVGDRAAIETKLECALKSLWIAYQPIVRGNGDPFGHEALLRCEEPLLPHPGAVLNAAERVGRLHDVGRAVRELVATDAEKDTDQSQLFFVNLHRDDLLDPSLYLPNAPLTRVARRVVLELTDRASLEAIKDVEQRVERLRTAGFRIALDNLGAGQAGLNVFTQLEPEFVKLDRSLTRGVHQDHEKARIVQSLVDLCHGMGKSIVAGGVESSGDRDVLVEAGCDFLQGYFFGRPGPFTDVEKRRLAQLSVA